MPIQYFTQNVASGAVSGTVVQAFGDGSRNVTVVIPSLASGTNINFAVSYDGSTYKNLYFPPLSGTVTPGLVTIGSGVTNCALPVVELRGQKFVKVLHTTAVTDVSANYQFIVEY